VGVAQSRLPSQVNKIPSIKRVFYLPAICGDDRERWKTFMGEIIKYFTANKKEQF